MLSLDPALAGRERAIHRAMQRRRQDRIGRAVRQMFGLRDEGCGSIVDQHVDLPSRQTDPSWHRPRYRRGYRIASRDLPSRSLRICAAVASSNEPAAADDQFRTEFDEAASHRGPSSEPPVTRIRFPPAGLFQTSFDSSALYCSPASNPARSFSTFVVRPKIRCVHESHFCRARPARRSRVTDARSGGRAGRSRS